MRSRPVHKVMLNLCCVAALGLVSAFGQEKQEKSAEPAKEARQNGATSSPSQQQHGLKQVEEDLFKPLKTFTPKSSLDGVFVPPSKPLPPRRIDEKKFQDKLDREKN